MVISSRRFSHEDTHKETRISPDGQTQNQIDHVLIDGRHSPIPLMLDLAEMLTVIRTIIWAKPNIDTG
jgi:hypothetical protein